MCGSGAPAGHQEEVQSGILQRLRAAPRPPGQPPPQKAIRGLLGNSIGYDGSDASQLLRSFFLASVALPSAELPALDLRELLDTKAVDIVNNFDSTVRLADAVAQARQASGPLPRPYMDPTLRQNH